jgi:poly-gamma-glutamate capsule biosynthesis protein CapA/YwtB (metallophosphatase superfamily)
MKRSLFLIAIIIAGVYSYIHFGSFKPIPSEAPQTASATPLSKPVLPTTLTIGFVGDMVPSMDDLYNSFAFARVAPVLQKPDLMIGNLEGTFAAADRTSKCIYIETNCHAFRGAKSFADSLNYAGFDFVSLVNNHSYDFGPEGLEDTQKELDRVGIPYISPTKPIASITIKKKRIGIIGLSSTPPAQTITDYTFIEREVRALKDTNDIVIVIFHGGAEGADKSTVPGIEEYMGTENRGNVALVAHSAIDAGADLVLGSGPHVLRKIEYYKNVPIAYSLGNFVGGKRLVTTDILGVSGIFTALLKDDAQTKHSFTSVSLSGDGIPSIDLEERGKEFIRLLSQ